MGISSSNRKRCGMFVHQGTGLLDDIRKDVQFEEREVCITIVCLALALMQNVFFEDLGGFGIVSIKAV